jgi:hypothetical protein
MENKHVLKLIDGIFMPSDAGNVLFDLISRKINYHQIELFSNEERFGNDLSNSISRIKQLNDVKNSLHEIIAYASEKGMSLKIESHIHITCIEEN